MSILNTFNKASIVFIIGLFGFFQQNLYAQKVEGIVIDDESRQPVSYVTIGVVNKSGGTYSDEKGNYSLDLSGYQHSDTLKFSCIGYKPEILTIKEVVDKYKNSSYNINLKVNRIQLSEVIVKPTKFKTKVLGNKISNKHIWISIGNNFGESGIVIPNDKKLFFNYASFDLAVPSTLDSVLLRFNVYGVKNKLPNDNILTQPIFIHLKKEQLVRTVNIDLEPYNIIVEKDFVASIEVVKKYGKGRLTYAGWITGCPTYWLSGKQGSWTIAQDNRNGFKLHQNLKLTVQYKK